MKGKQLLLLLLLVAVLGGIGYNLYRGNEHSWTGTTAGGGKVLEFPINDVDRITIKQASNELNLLKKDDQWVVQERGQYPASFEQVSGLLRKLWDLKTVQEVKVGASQMARLQLIEPGKGEGAGTIVEFKDKDGKVVGGALLGKQHLRKSEGGPMGDLGGFPSGRYVMPIGGSKVSLVSETLDEVEAKPERWLRKEFIKIESPKTITLAGTTDPMRWTLSRDTATGEWKLADAKPEEQPLDPAKVASFATLLSNAQFKDVLLADAKVEETGLDKPTLLTFRTFDGFKYAMKVGKLMNETYPVQFEVSADLPKERTPGKDEKPEDKAKLDTEYEATQKRLRDKLTVEKKLEGFIYVLEKFTLEPFLKERAGLLAEKKPEQPAAPGTSATPMPVDPNAPAPPVSVTTPPVSVTTPPVSVTTPPVTATTPPVAVPPMPKPETPAAPGAPPVAPPAEGAPAPKPDPAKPAPAPEKPAPPAGQIPNPDPGAPAPNPPAPKPEPAPAPSPVPPPVPPAPNPELPKPEPSPAPEAPKPAPPAEKQPASPAEPSKAEPTPPAE